MTTTAERIADAALRRFNRNGYHSTTLTDIARDAGISQGNLTYHFPTKLDLALHLSERVRVRTEARREASPSGEIARDYVDQLCFAMEMTGQYRFLMRDRGIFEPADAPMPPSPILVAGMNDRREMIGRIDDEGLFRADADIDLDVFARALWVLTRYWMDHLREMDGREEFEWVDVERGVTHHFSLLLPAMSATGRRRFTDALEQVSASRVSQ